MLKSNEWATIEMLQQKDLISQGVRNDEKKHSPYRRRYNFALLMFNMPRMQTQVVIKGLMWV
ncbi:hypothetical protein HpHA236_06570 [Helicobacter pylori]